MTNPELLNKKLLQRDFVVYALSRLFLVFLVAFGMLPRLTAAKDNWRTYRYGLEHGLSQISVNTIIQDSYGFLWIGTQDGLNKFNGYEFVVYRHQPSDPSSLSNSNIQSVIEDRDGNIWAGTQDGLNKFDRTAGTFLAYRHDPDNPESISSNNIYCVYQDRSGVIWLKTQWGIDRLDPETAVFTRFLHYNDELNYISGNNYFTIYEDTKDRLWAGSKDGLFFFNRDSEEFTRYYHDPSTPGSISNDNVQALYETADGYFLVGTQNGLNIFDADKGSFSSFHTHHPPGMRSRINSINSISEDKKGTVWVATDGGLYTFSPDKGQFSSFSQESVSALFSDLETSAVLEDRSGNLWIGTFDGLYMVDAKNKFTTYRIHDYMPEAPRASTFIASVNQAGNNNLWIGTWGGGLFNLDRLTGEVTHYSSNSSQRDRLISNDFIHVIFRDSMGRIILGTRDGLEIYRGERPGFESFCPSSNKEDCLVFNSNRVYCIYEDSRQTMWVGTRHGLHSFRGDSLTSYYHNPRDTASIASDQANDIIECREGYIWVATAGGLSRLNRETGKFMNFHRDPSMGRFSLSNNELTSLHQDSSGNLWVGSVAGLNRFFPGTGSFIVFSEMEGLPNNLIYSILEDNAGHLWLGTNHGLARFDPVSLDISVYDVADGLQSYEFNLGASFRSHNGELFFGGVAGLNAFFPDEIELNHTIPTLVLTSFEVSSPQGTRVINVKGKNEIVLPHDQNSVSIEFAALDFTRPGKNKYAYKLEGLEDNWKYPGNRRIANYSRIPSGTYIFRVRGSNNDGVWNEEGLALKIIVQTPWWQSVYAWILYAIITVFAIYLTVLYSTSRLRNANLLLREKELASAEISRQKEELTLKNNNITDSINYAKRIQLAMMPNSSHFATLFPESFVYYKSKDIVSGDFYWVNQIDHRVFLAVIDCTGHGVPGAFMSIIGYELLRNIINVKGISRPSEILNMLNDDFSGIFKQGEDKDFSFRDGMDIGFCVIDKKNSRLEFAGAFSPLYLVRNNSVIEIKGNRFSVGLMEDINDEKFENHSLKLQKNDMIYLFSDGYPDQFGGEEGKKFKYRRFRHLLLNIHTLPASRQMELLDQSIVSWMGVHEQVDDILIMGVRPGLGDEQEA